MGLHDTIQDHWIGYKPDGQESHGTNIRSFNPKTRKWDNRWLSAGSLQWAYLESKMVGDTMVMTGSGKTWIEGVGFIEARRAQD